MNEKLYYKIFRLTWASFCVECGKKDLHPSNFEIDETEAEKVLADLGKETTRLVLKQGFVNMRYVAGFKFERLDEKPLEDIVPSEMKEQLLKAKKSDLIDLK